MEDLYARQRRNCAGLYAASRLSPPENAERYRASIVQPMGFDLCFLLPINAPPSTRPSRRRHIANASGSGGDDPPNAYGCKQVCCGYPNDRAPRYGCQRLKKIRLRSAMDNVQCDKHFCRIGLPMVCRKMGPSLPKLPRRRRPAFVLGQTGRLPRARQLQRRPKTASWGRLGRALW